MKRLAVFFVIAGLFALAGCSPLDGPIFQQCSASNCPPPGSCQHPDTPMDGLSWCKTLPNASISVGVAALALESRR